MTTVNIGTGPELYVQICIVSSNKSRDNATGSRSSLFSDSNLRLQKAMCMFIGRKARVWVGIKVAAGAEEIDLPLLQTW